MHEAAVFELLGHVQLDLVFPGGRVQLEQLEEVEQVAAIFRRGELDLVHERRQGARKAYMDLVYDRDVLVLGHEDALEVVEVAAVGIKVGRAEDLSVEEQRLGHHDAVAQGAEGQGVLLHEAPDGLVAVCFLHEWRLQAGLAAAGQHVCEGRAHAHLESVASGAHLR